jgi:tetratricopeptide (TPR) repeat protein
VIDNEELSISSLKKILAQNLLEEALVCAKKACEKFPKNRDLSYYKARVLAWNKKPEDSLQELKKWESDDFETNILKGDIYWYQGDCEKVLEFYTKAKEKGSLKNFPKASALSYIKCTETLPTLKTNKKNASGQHQKELIHKENTFILVEATKSLNNRSTGEYHLYAQQRVFKPLSFSLELFDIYRQFSDLIQNDQLLLPGVQIDWMSHHQTKFHVGFSINSNFSYKNLQEINHTFYIGKTYISLILRRAEFEHESLYLYAPRIGHYIENFHFGAQFFHGIASKKHSFAFLLTGQYNHPIFFSSLSVALGKGDSTVSYILKNLESITFNYAIKLGLILTPSFQPYFIFEGRLEEKVHQSTIKLGASWSI